MARHTGTAGWGEEGDSVCLAMAFCMSGQRVLVLVDTDALFVGDEDDTCFRIGELSVCVRGAGSADCFGCTAWYCWLLYCAGPCGEEASSLVTWSCSLASCSFCQLRTFRMSGWMVVGR